MTNTKALNKAIKISGFKRKFIAEKLGLTPFGLQKKIQNINEFKASEIKILCGLLGISSQKEINNIFFAD